MLLTLKPSQHHGHPLPHAYSPAQRSPSSYSQRSPSSYYASPPKSAALPALPDTRPRRMSGMSDHRNLPPPAAMDRILPAPERAPPPNNMPMGALPAAPSQWHGQDESMRSWLHAKLEEDRRKQEEEKTRQESLRLEQRKVEQAMLLESLRAGVPPPMVPMIFASVGGGNVGNLTVDWAQHYMAQISLQQQAQLQQQQHQHPPPQLQQSQPQQQPQVQASPDQRRDSRLNLGPQPNPYGGQQMQPPSQNAAQAGQQGPPNSGFAPSLQGSTLAAERVRLQQPSIQAAPPTSNPRSQNSPSNLSRLNTGDLQIHAPHPPSSAPQLSGQHPLQQTQSAQQQDSQSSSSPLYIHQWVPPGSQGASKDKDPGTPSGKSQHGSPYSQNQQSHRRSDYNNTSTTSPKKRKATGTHQAAPEPSPSFSHHSSGPTTVRRRRSRHPSDASSRATHDLPRQRTDKSRQSLSETGSSRTSAQPETRHPQHRNPAGTGPEMRQASRERDERNSPKREM